MARVITAPGIVRNVSKYLNSMRRVPFAIGKDDWTEVDSSTYTYEFVTPYVTTSSFDIGTFDNSVRNYAKGDINMEKKDGGGGMVFTTTKRPTGTVSGSIYIWDNNDNKVPVILEDTVVPIENGGTGATSIPGILSALGLGSANDAQETLEFGDAVHEDVANNVTTTSEGYVLDARQGKVLKDSVDALNDKFRYFSGFESCTFTITNQAFVTGINSINVTFDHELSNTPSFILCMMPQTSVWFVSAYSLSKTGATVRMYTESAFTATSMVVRCLTVY